MWFMIFKKKMYRNHDDVTLVVFSTTLQYNAVLSDIYLCHEIAPHVTFYIALNVVAN